MEPTISKYQPSQSRAPKLKLYFITLTTLLVIAIVFGQLYQDNQRKNELLDAQRVDHHHELLALTTSLMNDLKAIGQKSNDVRKDKLGKQLSQNGKYLRVLQQGLAATTSTAVELDNNQALAQKELGLVVFLEQLIVVVNEVEASIAAGSVDENLVSARYHHLLPLYHKYQEDTAHIIAKMNSHLTQVSYENRRIVWVIVTVIIMLVISLGIGFYRLISGLVSRQFELIERENQARIENEQALLYQSELATHEHMKLRSILDSTTNAVTTMTTEGLIKSFNKTAEKMFGFPAEHVIGKKLSLLLLNSDFSALLSFMKNYDRSGDKGWQMTSKRVDGSEFPVYLSLNIIQLSSPKLFTVIFQDISAWKESDDKLRTTLESLTNKQQLLAEEERIAKHVFENITSTNNDPLPGVTSWSKPMGSFSGDMMLSSKLPSGGFRVLLCDFTGHGLPAALGAVPVSSIHAAMAQKGLSLEILMDELNEKLKTLLPTGIFCCIAGIDIDAARVHAQIWNSGLPNVLLVSKDGIIKQQFSSNHLPLGVVAYRQEELHCFEVSLEAGDSLYTFSDGLSEAENESGEMFGQQRFESLLTTALDQQGRLAPIKNEVHAFIGDAKATDDISLIEIRI